MTAHSDEHGPGHAGAPTPPNPRQQQILDAYFLCPNAAAVARTTKSSERNVRRIVALFARQLGERRQQRDDERLRRIDARHARTQDWADAGLEKALARLDELAASPNDGAALRALKVKLDIFFLHPGAMPARQTSETDRLLGQLLGDLAEQQRELEGPDHEEP